ncbi:protein-glutamine gamma-glutamyltransferase [Virgibacillus necropolis]|uniref:protein-glutamine gamma-glutamyltransferase n=1 Tax=Virgibacillus necropolis TaxID=163877 RepID=UPI00384E1C9D
MINISGTAFHWDELIEKVSISGKGKNILKQLENSSKMYHYRSFKDLESTIHIRELIMEAASKLNDSHASFAVFRETRANDRYWSITGQGGIRLKQGVKPSAAIRDIYKNGDQYAFECATAMIMVYYYAALEYLGTETFNNYFTNLYLYSWNTDADLRLKNDTVKEPIPGDIVYFNNPDHLKPQWQGENAVFLGDNLYYGHGLGILSAEEMIRQLNILGESSEQDAYMIDMVVTPSFDHLIALKNEYRRSGRTPTNRVIVYESIYHHNQTSISYSYYLSLVSMVNAGTIKITINGTLD